MSKTDTTPITLPSREFMPDGSKNPEYDRTLDPSNNLWNPEKYFGLMETWRMHISSDRDNPHITTVPLSINGYPKVYMVESEQDVPRDFAELIQDRKLGWRVG